MLQRIITGAILLAVLALIMFVGHWVVGAVAMLVICVSMYEEFKALKQAGHRPITVPTWIAAIVSVPLTYFFGIKALGIVLVAAAMVTAALVIFRHDPKL